jgi:hypothetical protein
MENSEKKLGIPEVRKLVEAYFLLSSQPKALAGHTAATQKEIDRVLDAWTDTIPEARWAKSIVGILPAMAAGLAAHIEIEAAPTVGRIWRFAGLDPSVSWQRGQRRPWNGSLKALCQKIGEAFVAAAGKEGDFYGKLYLERRAAENAANQGGKFAQQARRELERPGLDAFARRRYEKGKLPPGHIDSRARRWAVKLFLAHYHHVAWTLATGTPPVKPYAIGILGRGEYIAPPNFDGGVR